MQKNTVINARINQELKQKSESILNELGLNMSQAIDLFLNQIVQHNGLPFEIKKANQDVVDKRILLANAINLTGGKEVDPKFNKIINLYASGQIDYDLALYAVRREFAHE